MPIYIGSLSWGSSAFTPKSPGSLVAWYDASQLGLANGAGILSLPDLSGNGHDLGVVDNTRPPTFTTGAVNGQGAALVGGAQAFISASTCYSTLVSAQPITISNVWKATTTPGGNTNIYNTVTFAQTANMGTNVFGTQMGISAGNQQTITGFPLDTAVHYAVIVFNGASTIVHIDGTSYSLSGNPGNSYAQDLTLPDTTGGWSPMTGYECEWIYYSRALTTAEIAQMETYLAGKWG